VQEQERQKLQRERDEALRVQRMNEEALLKSRAVAPPVVPLVIEGGLDAKVPARSVLATSLLRFGAHPFPPKAADELRARVKVEYKFCSVVCWSLYMCAAFGFCCVVF
jgi:hypothetical protein